MLEKALAKIPVPEADALMGKHADPASAVSLNAVVEGEADESRVTSMDMSVLTACVEAGDGVDSGRGRVKGDESTLERRSMGESSLGSIFGSPLVSLFASAGSPSSKGGSSTFSLIAAQFRNSHPRVD